MSNGWGEFVTILALVFSFLALCISFVALWKGHFAKFSPVALAGSLELRIYPFRNSDERWFIASFLTAISVSNPGARPGLVTGVRLRLRYPELPFADSHELLYAIWELKPDKLQCIDENRLEWIANVVAADWAPFVVLPKATVSKPLLLEARWEMPVVQKRIVASMEIQTDWRKEWVTVDEWTFAIRPEIWVDLETGRAIRFDSDKSQGAKEPICSPPDLHKYTGTKAQLPSKGGFSSMEPSRLDYKDTENTD